MEDSKYSFDYNQAFTNQPNFDIKPMRIRYAVKKKPKKTKFT